MSPAESDALKVLGEAMGEAIEGAGIVQACHIIVSQRDNARQGEKVFGQRLHAALACDNDELRLVKVHYGSDIGLVSLRAGKLLVATWNTGNFSVMSGIPSVSVSDLQAYQLFGEEHSWDDVILMLKNHYDWQSKSLPDHNELMQHYAEKEEN
jgi:hypothetical protein